MKLNNIQKRRIQRAVRLGAWDVSKRIDYKKSSLECEVGRNKQRLIILRG